MALLEHWQLWREKCALARCTDAAQHDLQGFAFDRFNHYLQKCRHTLAAPAATEAWHAFESYLALGRNRTTKAWKQWLFARSNLPVTLDAVQGGATLVMRDVVREHLRREHTPTWITSLDAPLPSHHEEDNITPLSITDLLPDPDDALRKVEANEYRTLALKLSPALDGTLSVRQKIALTVHHSGKALYHPTALTAAGCSKSSLCNAWRQAINILANGTNTALPQECAYARMHIAANLLDIICADTRKMLEKTHPELFRYLEESEEHGEQTNNA